MKGLAICNKGIEDIVVLDIKEILKQDASAQDGFVTFKIKENNDLCKLIYLSQSIKKVILILDEFEFKNEKEILARAKKLDLSGWLSEKKTFKVDSSLIDSKLNAEETQGNIGKVIIENIKNYKQKVDLENPDIVLFIFINKNKAFIGIDFSGIELSKREYRIFSTPKNIKATIAYAMVRLSGFEKGQTLLDPFCLAGAIPIEAALFENNFSMHYYNKKDFLFNKFTEFNYKKIDDKKTFKEGKILASDSQFRHIDASRKNAKIAGINKAIQFSKVDVEWLDTKNDKASIDRIVTYLPNITKYSNKKDLLKLYDEFFHQAEFIVKNTGSILICTKNPEEIIQAAEKQGFKLEFQKEVWQGKEKLFLLKLHK